MRVLILLVAVLQSVSLQAGDITLISKNFDKDKNDAGQTNFYFKGEKLLIENKFMSDDNSLIFDSVKKEFIFIDHQKKEYYQVTESELKNFVAQIRQMLQMTKAFLNNMPPEQQELIKKSLGKYLDAGSQPETTFSKASSGVKVMSWSTDKYNAIQNETKVGEMYLASHKDMGVSREDFKSFEVMSEVFSQTIMEFVGVLPMGPSVQGMAANLDDNPAFREGIPVKSLSFVDGKLSGENQVMEILKREIAADKFSTPNGYQRKKLEMPQIGK
ncbi:MAG: hypothetical protein O2887_02055 [Bacteroidetes bacterium]|nr:hypothetical protein [Bacteroidota bacterium]MDA1119274.1 hypothetical protein [Bacteroidota bacterium]